MRPFRKYRAGLQGKTFCEGCQTSQKERIAGEKEIMDAYLFNFKLRINKVTSTTREVLYKLFLFTRQIQWVQENNASLLKKCVIHYIYIIYIILSYKRFHQRYLYGSLKYNNRKQKKFHINNKQHTKNRALNLKNSKMNTIHLYFC